MSDLRTFQDHNKHIIKNNMFMRTVQMIRESTSIEDLREWMTCTLEIAPTPKAQNQIQFFLAIINRGKDLSTTKNDLIQQGTAFILTNP